MDLSAQPLRDLPTPGPSSQEHTNRSYPFLQPTPATQTQTPLADERRHKNGSNTFQGHATTSHDLSVHSNDVLGQFSFAPATQTTIVTTTTTTTTKLPPFLLKAPNYLRHSDPQQYPLAFVETPQVVKCLEFGSGCERVIFREADHTIEALEDVGLSLYIFCGSSCLVLNIHDVV